MNATKFPVISIPYGAIKSDYYQNTSVIPQIFQFLMVRLKAKREPVATSLALSFQFLMVRLKDYFERGITMSDLISIPYGAIKSF